jgi:hypothetical protein
MHPRLKVTGQSSLEYLRWQVASFLSTERALRDDPSIRHRLNGSGNVLLAAFAGDHKVMESH